MADLMAAEILRGDTAHGLKRPGGARATVALDTLGVDAPLPRGDRAPAPEAAARARRTEFVDLKALGALPAPAAVDATIGDVQSFAPVVAEPATVRPARAWQRSAPLAVIGAVTILAFAAVSWRFAGRAAVEGAAPDTPVAAAPARTVTLAPATVQIGMSEDNKEAYLAACWRISQNTNSECRVTWLEQHGEFPGRTQAFPALRVDAYEVSNGDWDACVQAGACAPRSWDACRTFGLGDRYLLGESVPAAVRGPEHPATCVTYGEAAGFCAWRDMRLPTNAEWERLARGGDDRMYPWGNFWAPALMNWAEADALGYPVAGRLDGAELTAPVTNYPDGASPEGIYNAWGNVEEWTVPDADVEEGLASVRGGSYALDLASVRMTLVRTIRADDRRTTVGFRCVGDAE